MTLLDCFYIFMTALFTSLIVVPFLRKWALDQNNVDIPDERKIHDTPMPRLGGVAIFLSFLFSIIVFVPVTPMIRGFLAGGLIVFITGLVDDLTELPAKRKFAGQVLACLVTIVLSNLWLTNLGDLFGFGDILLPAWIGIPFTVFAVVGVINAINLIDGLDGLAGGVSVIALTAFGMLGWLEGDRQTIFISLGLAGSLLGFLKYNFYPARIFMGDAGSLTVGFILGFLAVYTTQHAGATTSPMAPVLILGMPLLDTVWVMSRRISLGQSPFSADRTHVHHKFLDLGIKHRLTVLFIYSLSLFWSCAALLLRTSPEYLLLLLLLSSAAAFYLGLRFVLRNPERFTFIKSDAMSGIRQSSTYQRIASVVDRAVPTLLYLLCGFLLLALWSTLQHNVLQWQVVLAMLVAGLLLWFRPLTEGHQFLMLVLYVAVGMAALEVWHSNEVLFAGITFKRLGDVLLLMSALILVFKLQFSRSGAFFLSSADFLALGLCVFMAIASRKYVLGLDINGPLLRGIILVLSVRILCSRNQYYFKMVFIIVTLYLALSVALGTLN